jgi:hypothetical protein
LSEAAQGEPPQHEVYEKPFKVEPAYERWPTPENYRRYPGGESLPRELTVWRVQQTGGREVRSLRPYGAVSRAWKSGETAGTEALTLGYNTGKMSGAVAVGRDGNFLQWGFSAPPSTMTEAGRRLFLNCICYIAKFDGRTSKPGR